MLQVVRPCLMLLGQEILYDVSKPLDSNPQSMERNLRSVTHCPGVKFARSSPSLQGQMLKQCTAGTNASCTVRQGTAPLPPLFLIEFFECLTSFILLIRLAAVEDMHECLGHGITTFARSGRSIFRPYFQTIRHRSWFRGMFFTT